MLICVKFTWSNAELIRSRMTSCLLTRMFNFEWSVRILLVYQFRSNLTSSPLFSRELKQIWQYITVEGSMLLWNCTTDVHRVTFLKTNVNSDWHEKLKYNMIRYEVSQGNVLVLTREEPGDIWCSEPSNLFFLLSVGFSLLQVLWEVCFFPAEFLHLYLSV